MRTNEGKFFSTELGSSFGGLWRFIGNSSNYWCANDYSNINEVSLLELHPYFIAIILNLLANFFKINSLTFATYFISFIFVIFVIFIILKIFTSGLSVISKFLLALAFVINPIILSSIQGQLYFDKILIYIGPIAIFFMNNYYINKTQKFYQVFFFSVLLILVSERGAIYIFIISSYFLFLSILNKQITNESLIDKKNFILPLISISYIFYWFTFLQVSPYYSGTSLFSVESINQRLISLFGENLDMFLYPFLAFTVPLIVVTLIFSVKLAVLGLVLILPNILISIGGAELSGYYTHYHALYAGSLWILMLLALKQRQSSTSEQRDFARRQVLNISTIIIILFTLHWYGSVGAIVRNIQAIYNPTFTLYEQKQDSDQLILKNFVDSFDNDYKYSVSRQFFPYFAMKDTMSIGYFPVLLGEADYIFVLRDPEEKLILDHWLISDQSNLAVVQNCLDNKLKQYPFRFEMPLGGYVVNVYSKTKLFLS